MTAFVSFNSNFVPLLDGVHVAQIHVGLSSRLVGFWSLPDSNRRLRD